MAIRNHRAVVILFFLFLAGSAFSEEGKDIHHNVGRGQLTAQFLSLGQLMLPGPTIHFPSCPLPGDWRSEVSLYWGNVWNDDAQGQHYRIDGEWLHSSLTLSRRWTQRWSAGARLPFIGRTGGFADAIIEDFHKAFGFENFHRTDYPRNRTIIEYDDNKGHTHRIEGDDWGLGDVSLFLAWWATPGNHRIPSIDFYTLLSLPTGDKEQLRGMGAVQAGGGMRLSKQLGNPNWYGYLIIQGLYAFTDEIGGIDLYPFHGATLAAVEYVINRRLSLIGQTAISAPAAKDFYDFSDPVYEAALGLKWQAARQSLLEFSFVENLFDRNNSVDFGLHLAWTQGF